MASEIQVPIVGIVQPGRLPRPPKSYGKAVCDDCGGPVSTYTPPQPDTEVRYCNAHWRLPDWLRYTPHGHIVRIRNHPHYKEQS